MSSYELSRLLHDLGQGALDPDAVKQPGGDLRGKYQITDEEEAALRSGDIVTLENMGVHPLLLMNLAPLLGIDVVRVFQDEDQ